MPRQLHLEGPALEPLLEQARAEHGQAVVVVGAQRVRRGGIAGFFAREHYEVTVEVPDPTDPAAVPVAAAPVRGGGPAATLEELLAMADRADGAGALAEVRARAATAPVLTDQTAYRLAARGTRTGVPAARTSSDAATPPSLAAAAVPVPPAGPSDSAAPAVPVGAGEAADAVRLPGRTLSTESRTFDEVLAALRADLLGPGSTDALDARYETSADGRDRPGAAASPWQPVTVLDEPDLLPVVEVVEVVVTGTDARPDVAVPAVAEADLALAAPAAEAAPAAQAGVTRPATVEAAPALVAGPETVDAPPDAVAHAVDVLDEDLLDELLGLAVAVGAGRDRAAAAAADVASSGVRRLHHALPVLAAALADAHADVAPDGGPDEVLERDPRLLQAGPGDVVVVVGAPDRVAATAAQVAAQLGTPWLATWSDEPARRGTAAGEVLRETRALPVLAGRARADERPVVVALPDPSLAAGVPAARAGRDRAGLLRSLDPDLVVLVAEADASRRRQGTVTGRVAAAHGPRRPLVLALVGCDVAAAPLGHAGRPVALLDGLPATAGLWTGVLLDALRSAASR